METGLQLAAVAPSAADPNAVLFADQNALNHLIKMLRNLQKQQISFQLAAAPVDDTALELLTVVEDDNPLRVTVVKNSLKISGSKEAFNQLVEELELYIEYNDLDEPGMHHHIDPPSNQTSMAWIATDSTPLMVAGWKS